MSSLSYYPYGKILKYWNNKLTGKSYHKRFLLTKTFEIYAFKNNKSDGNKVYEYIDFPNPLINKIPFNAKICVVIPTFIKTKKDKQDISNLLDSIERLKTKPTEIIIIDDCSPIKLFFPSKIYVHRLTHNSGPAIARNIGKQIALERGADIISFTDTDCILSNNWIDIILQSFLKYRNFQIISGNTLSYDSSWLGKYHNMNGTLNGRKFKDKDQLLYGTTANLAITKEVAEKIDFDEHFTIAAGEDIAFCFRANQRGFAIKYVPEMKVQHNYGYNGNLLRNLNKFRTQFNKYSLGEIILLKEIPQYYTYFERTEEIPSL